MKSYLLFKLGKINSVKKLRDACRHNKREIQNELGANSHIDSSLKHLNYSLGSSLGTDDAVEKIREAIDAYEDNFQRKIRKDAVLVLELLFSLPLHFSKEKQREFFQKCLDWSLVEFDRADLISADVHLDESNPHMHVLLSCVKINSLLGAKLAGYGSKFNERKVRFFDQVAKEYELVMPTLKLKSSDRKRLAHEVYQFIEQSKDPITVSPAHNIIRSSIEEDPLPYAALYGLQVKLSPIIKKNRTLTQIFISKGKGKSWGDGDEVLPV